MSARSFLVSGLIAGFVAGLLAFGVAHTIGEPPVDNAIAYEESGGHHHEHGGHDHGDEAEPVSRQDQSTWGLLTSTVVVGAALGGIVALIAAFAVGRMGSLRPTASTALVCSLGFVGFSLVPFLKYPANPPGAGSADTIGSRTAEYFAMVVLSLAFTFVAVYVAKLLAPRIGAYGAIALPIVGFVVVTAVTAWLMPSVDEVPHDFPADVLWNFRMASIAVQAVLWGTITLVLAGLVERSARKARARQARRDLIGTAR